MQGSASGGHDLTPWAAYQPRLDDPQEADGPDDERITVTRRGLARVALMAAEAGARFQRDGLVEDCLEWLMEPQPLFDGLAPIDACLDEVNCRRALLLHGLGLDLDVDPDRLDRRVAGLTG